MTKYQPLFPHSVCGNRYRRPLKTPAFECISLEADRIYSTVDLSHVERAHLLEIHENLQRAERNSLSELPPAPDMKHCIWTLPVVMADFAEFKRRNGIETEGSCDDI